MIDWLWWRERVSSVIGYRVRTVWVWVCVCVKYSASASASASTLLRVSMRGSLWGRLDREAWG